MFLIASTFVTDDILLPDGSQYLGLAGGAGMYALTGAKIWTDDVEIVTGVGEDFFGLHGAWCERNGLSTAYMTVKDRHTPRTTVRYFADGEREELPHFGATHYRLMEPTPEEVNRALQDVRSRPGTDIQDAGGVYVFKNADIRFWEPLLGLKEDQGFKLLWEIAADATFPENLDTVTAIARRTDVFSLNRQEAAHLFSTNRIEEIICGLRSLGTPWVYLRMGAEGARIILNDRTIPIPSMPGVQVVDATGGGNSASGAVLCGYCEGRDPLMSGIMGSVSAACCISQYGPPPVIDAALRTSAARAAESLYLSQGTTHR